MTEDPARNCLICRTVAGANAEGLSLILTGRVDHCHSLRDILKKDHGIDAVVLTGKTRKKEREQIFERITQGDVRYIISTQSLLKEGFDLPALQYLFLVFPIKWKGSLIQMIGRILRPSDGKEYADIFDFCDFNVGVLKNSARIRAQVYEAENISRAA